MKKKDESDSTTDEPIAGRSSAACAFVASLSTSLHPSRLLFFIRPRPLLSWPNYTPPASSSVYADDAAGFTSSCYSLAHRITTYNQILDDLSGQRDIPYTPMFSERFGGSFHSFLSYGSCTSLPKSGLVNLSPTESQRRTVRFAWRCLDFFGRSSPPAWYRVLTTHTWK